LAIVVCEYPGWHLQSSLGWIVELANLWWRGISRRTVGDESKKGGYMKLLVMAIILSLVVASATRGAATVDQQYSFTSSIANSTNGDVTQIGETFTVGLAGTLDHIDVFMFRLNGIFDPTGDPRLSVWNTSGGLPTGAALTSVTVSEPLVPLNNAAFVSFDVSAAGISVNVGDVLAFSVIATAGVGPYFLPNDQGQQPGYPGGAAVAMFGSNPWQFIPPPQDHSFRTFVNVAAQATADFDSNGLVDGADFLAWQRGFGTLLGATRAAGNANVGDDGDVDAGDLAVWQTQYGTAGAASRVMSVPEPASAIIVIAVCAAIAVRLAGTCKPHPIDGLGLAARS
jgi:hypothetical protein